MKFGGYEPEVIYSWPSCFERIELECVREGDGRCEVDNKAPEIFAA
ncbi:hypothetical protein PCE31107_02995 [Pandoraea cepalis]|uniref:Uncharacterized protein n=2 Tax=Pandoraea TaxID=93217 RepID=A0A5E4XHV2_9BURK|nr:hypothetical protein PCE31107_02995 [Pandoraea cepalis]VVE35775.1 hypothetical protein PTE31013_03916 [Pandoraea terrigena]